jgi:hypothetical protein
LTWDIIEICFAFFLLLTFQESSAANASFIAPSVANPGTPRASTKPGTSHTPFSVPRVRPLLSRPSPSEHAAIFSPSKSTALFSPSKSAMFSPSKVSTAHKALIDNDRDIVVALDFSDDSL